MKTLCRKCGEEKLEVDFEMLSTGTRRKICKICRSAQQKAWRDANAERHKATVNAWVQANKDRLDAYHAEYREKHRELLRNKNRELLNKCREIYNSRRRLKRIEADPEVLAAKAAASYQKHREKRIAAMRTYAAENYDVLMQRNARRRAYSKSAVVQWDVELTALVVKEAKILCSAREQVTGIKWHIDHVLPLRGKNVCGLHVHNNIAVIPEAVNRRKKNRVLDSEVLVWI